MSGLIRVAVSTRRPRLPAFVIICLLGTLQVPVSAQTLGRRVLAVSNVASEVDLTFDSADRPITVYCTDGGFVSQSA